MRHVGLLLLLAVAWSDEPEGRRPVIPPDDPFPWCGTGRVWTGPLRVRVVSRRGGAPVAGIEVALKSGAAATTDASGIARFERADSTDTLRIRAVAYHPFEEYVPEADDELLVELKPGIPIRGRVRLADGSPAHGARAVCWDRLGINMLDAPQIVDDQGRFAIAAVAKATPVQLMVSLEACAPLEIRCVLLREEAELNLELGGQGGIEGVVTPPADVYVRAAHRTNPLRLDRGDEMQRESIEMETAFARPDAKGRYRIDGLAVPGAYVVCAGANESALVELSTERPRATVDLSSAAGPARTICVLDERGKPVKEPWIALVGATRQEIVQTSDDGTVGLPPGEWRVDVNGYLAAPAAPVVQLDRGITLRGVVCDADGAPVAGRWVYFSHPSPEGRYRFHHATTDPGGRFAISGLTEGEGWLTAAPERLDDGRIRIRAGMEELRVTPPAPARVVGRLAPVPRGISCATHAGVVAKVKSDGSFRVEGIPSGRAIVLGLAIDEGRVRLDLFWPSLEPGSTLDLGTLRVDSSAAVTGVVEDPSGRPVECAAVHIAVGNPYEPTYTDEKGAFSIPVSPVTPVVLKVGAPGFASRYVSVAKPGTAPVRLVLDPGGLVRGRVLGADGRPVPGAYIVFWRRLDSGQLSPYEDWKPETDSVGRFEIRLPPGTYHARFYDMAFSHARIPGPDVAVHAGETMDLEIRLP